ncbi:trypsin-like serine peptidase [Actinophytocola xanthii]|uniref:Peptidase n=1 Tax=Actinophytocola xanthii TaxID=1912961 RepID=A0A1Q8CP63_9PSEU|nr:peptidase [Actinophytocola xanthii]OLF16147.1 peptidase [Actinophytocola xanthii]
MRKLYWPTLLAVTGLAVTALAGPATAAPASPVGVHRVAASPESVAARWTPEAMRSAVPIERLLPAADARELTRDVRRGTPQVVPPTSPPARDVTPMAFPEGGAPWPGGGAIESTAGRVFFTYAGRRASCSGNAVTSANKSVVMTAGHCVKLDGAWHTDWVFVPAYDNGATPYGTWSARATFATPQWTATEDINYDVGAAVVAPLSGQSLTDVVGAQGIAFNQARGQNMYAFGWPAAAPYDGSQMVYCSGRTFNALISDGIGMTCDMTGGSSGGPWLLNFTESTGTGIQNSVNSYKINFIPTWMFGPYFGTDAQGVYTTAQAA